jgi:hypothetical protein
MGGCKPVSHLGSVVVLGGTQAIQQLYIIPAFPLILVAETFCVTVNVVEVFTIFVESNFPTACPLVTGGFMNVERNVVIIAVSLPVFGSAVPMIPGGGFPSCGLGGGTTPGDGEGIAPGDGCVGGMAGHPVNTIPFLKRTAAPIAEKSLVYDPVLRPIDAIFTEKIPQELSG